MEDGGLQNQSLSVQIGHRAVIFTGFTGALYGMGKAIQALEQEVTGYKELSPEAIAAAIAKALLTKDPTPDLPSHIVAVNGATLTEEAAQHLVASTRTMEESNAAETAL